ncbi:MAG: transposase [bacterium]
MLRKDLLVHKTKTLLGEFLDPMLGQLDKPRQRFLRQTVRAILFSGSLVVMELCKWVRDKCSDPFYQDKRLLNNLVSPHADLAQAATAYRRSLNRYIQPQSPLVIDLTDLAKPRARKMKYLALVRDGSEGKLVNGYWCIEIYAHLKGKRALPLALDVYGIEDPAVGSENLQIERVVDAVNRDLKGNGVWVADRGFDRLELYEMWFSRNCHFVVRQRGDRTVITAQGTRVILKNYVETLAQHNALEGQPGSVVFAKVYLPGYDTPLYVVASWLPGHDEPLILLTTLVVETMDQARSVLGYYRKRWICEEAGQFLKSRIGLERFRVRRYVAIQRLAILAMLAMGFLTWILLRSRDLTKRLFSLTSRFRKEVIFKYYRLLDGIQEFIRLNPNEFLIPPPDPGRNG